MDREGAGPDPSPNGFVMKCKTFPFWRNDGNSLTFFEVVIHHHFHRPFGALLDILILQIPSSSFLHRPVDIKRPSSSTFTMQRFSLINGKRKFSFFPETWRRMDWNLWGCQQEENTVEERWASEYSIVVGKKGKKDHQTLWSMGHTEENTWGIRSIKMQAKLA